MNWFRKQLSKELWSPYAAGILLGITGILTVLLTNNILGASGAFENLAGLFGQAVAPDLFDNIYFNYVMPPGISWGVLLLTGIFIGGLIGALSSKTLRVRDNDDSQWKKIFGPERWKRWLIAFLGAIILEYGAGIAGGCTSGLAISGGMLLAPGAFIFIMGMFASGIITTIVVYKKRY